MNRYKGSRPTICKGNIDQMKFMKRVELKTLFAFMLWASISYYNKKFHVSNYPRFLSFIERNNTWIYQWKRDATKFYLVSQAYSSEREANYMTGERNFNVVNTTADQEKLFRRIMLLTMMEWGGNEKKKCLGYIKLLYQTKRGKLNN